MTTSREDPKSAQIRMNLGIKYLPEIQAELEAKRKRREAEQRIEALGMALFQGEDIP
jgi:hypothetical protein